VTIDEIAQELFAAVRPSRVTIRGAAFGRSDPTFLHVEICAPGAVTMAGAPQDGIPTAPTYRWLTEHRTLLVQNDCRDDPRPPSMLTEHFGVGAQLLGPLLRSGALVGTISVHQQGGPRRWSDDDVRALGMAVTKVSVLWELDEHGSQR